MPKGKEGIESYPLMPVVFGQMDKPDVDYIEGLFQLFQLTRKPLAVIPAHGGDCNRNLDYLRLLFARIGIPHCPNCGKPLPNRQPNKLLII